MEPKITLSLAEAKKIKGLLFSREWPLPLVNELAPVLGVLDDQIKAVEPKQEEKQEDGNS